MRPPVRGDAKRQAHATIRGYMYQIHQTVLAWLDLFDDPNGIIFIEAAEDFDVQRDGSVELTQVRDTRSSTSISLSNKKVRDFLTSYHSFKIQKPDTKITGRYLTTSSVAKERGLDFPGNAKGIEYWNLVSRGLADSAPLFEATRTLSYGDDLQEWLRDCSEEEFVQGLVENIRWCTNEPDTEPIIRLIETQLSTHGAKFGLLSVDCKKAYAPLLAHAARISSKKEDRYLDHQTLHEVFENSVRKSVPTSRLEAFERFEALGANLALERRSPLPAGAPLMPLDEMPIRGHTVERTTAIDACFESIKANSIVILKGSTGVGKSTLAHQIPKRDLRRFSNIYHSDLRDASRERVSASIFSAINLTLANPEPNVFILDDVNLSPQSCDMTNLAVLVSSLQERNGICIITSNKGLTATRLETLNLDETAIFSVPYFSESEVEELISLHNGMNTNDDGMWASAIYISSNLGHPQLVHALVLSLKQKGWPRSEIPKLLSQPGSEAITEETADARKRLIDSTPTPSTRTLAYRLSLLIGNFSRKIAIGAGSIEPKIELPGDAFDMLVGPWIEERYGNRYAVSPLLRNAAKEVFEEDEIQDFYFNISGVPLKDSPIDVRDFQSAIIHATLGKNTPVIVTASHIILTKLDEEPVIADGLWMLPMLGPNDGSRIYPEDESVSSLLRIAQFVVAAKLDDKDRATSLGRTMLAEARSLSGEKAPAQSLMAIFKYLSERELPSFGTEVVNLCLELKLLLKGNPDLEEIRTHLTQLYTEMFSDTKVELHQILFAMGVARLPSLKEFVSCIDRLTELSTIDREDLLLSLQKIGGIDFLFVHRGWISEHQRGNTEYHEWVSAYEHACHEFRGWNRNDLALEATVCISVIQDEYMKDQATALKYLDELPDQEAHHPIALHQRAKVLSNSERHVEAHAVWGTIEADMQSFEGVNAVFALRLSAISAAETNDWPSAIKRYQWAIDATKSAEGASPTMHAGLVGDLGLACWKSGLIDQALAHLHSAVKLALQTDENESLSANHMHALLGHAVGWVWNESKRLFSSEIAEDSEKNHHFENGMCSNPSPHPEIGTKALPGSQHTWLLLATVENLVGSNNEIRRSYFEKYGNTGSALTYSEDCRSRVTRSIIDSDVELFRESVIPFIIATTEVRKWREIEAPTDNPTSETIDFPTFDDWEGADEKELEIVIHVALTFLTMSMLNNEDYFSQAYAITEYLEDNWKGNSNRIVRVLDLSTLRESAYQSEDADLGWAYTLAKAKSLQDIPGDSLIFYYNAVNFFRASLWKDQIGHMLAKECRTTWLHFANQASFMLSSPALYKEDIVRACQSDHPSGLGAVAKILIASAPASGRGLSKESLDYLQRVTSE